MRLRLLRLVKLEFPEVRRLIAKLVFFRLGAEGGRLRRRVVWVVRVALVRVWVSQVARVCGEVLDMRRVGEGRRRRVRGSRVLVRIEVVSGVHLNV